MGSFERIEALLINSEIGPRVLHEHNTAVFLHNEYWRGVDHIFEETDDLSGVFFWRAQVEAAGGDFDDMTITLGEIGCEVFFNEEPSEMDYLHYRYQEDKLVEQWGLNLPDGMD